jgi:leucyl-tRNA synthetase
MVARYTPREIDAKWQQKWADDGLYRVSEDNVKPKWYALTMFPYTSGDLHIGHWYAMAPSDVHARFKRMQGFNVLHPMGFDAFGLPAENAAIKRGIHPYTWTMQNIENMRRQLKSIGAIYDWEREVITCQPEYYKWTQWFFIKLYEAGLAYRDKAPVNWCPQCQTVLANEQVLNDGLCERCDTPVIRRDLEQWFFRITRYADELMQHQDIDWPESIKIMQHNWVGSHGAEISFGLDEGSGEGEIRVFTTRPDTTFGVTFMVLAPEHPLVARLTTPEKKGEVEAYITKSRRQSDIERLSTEKEKDGVFTGAYAVNRLSGSKVPIWIADYVLLGYGTGAVMAVPAHDERDFAFAKKYDLPIRVVISPPEWDGGQLEEAFIGEGTMVNSGRFDGLSNRQGIDTLANYLKEQNWGGPSFSYKLRDWLISRQRYWGTPIPIIYCPDCGTVSVPEKDLPVLLPQDAEFKPTGESPLKYNKGFVNTACPNCSGPARRETDTIDTFMDSNWYFLRYTSPDYDKSPFDPARLNHWMPVDLYTGGAEHAVMHLLYARFFHKAIRDLGLVDFNEPFRRLFNQGIIIAAKQKMSKSKGNVVNPDVYVDELGADAVRAYLMFIGPWEQGGEWNDNGLSGMSRWLKRIWQLVLDAYQPGSPDEAAEQKLTRLLHQTVRKASRDLEKMRFNTMLAALMEFTNHLTRVKESGTVSAAIWQEAIETLLKLLAPTAPHLAEEMWLRTSREYSIHNQPWPEWDEALAEEEQVILVVQVNGKVRLKLTAPAAINEADARQMALGNERIMAYTTGKKVTKVIYVPGKLINLVIQ